ncbi:hypothetical protein HFK18_13125|uniref:hypothetical protein n=1 Tax=Stenotrophomonas sp. SbOxS2 TaxID=2723885 RepID=UPI0015D2B33C|nr:hypothetical protein [Stenotrophomonas sp. SbOxS2]NYT99419.1 hypothetical protein [Stenotrophomonas sp. SbOxS2]
MAWLLSLLLVLLLWMAAAGPRNPLSDDGQHHVYYLDASAWLMSDGAFGAARAALERDVAGAPTGARQVVLGDGVASLLLASDEPLALLQARLRDATARARPSAFASWLASVSALGQGDGQAQGDIVVHYYGAAPVLRAARETLPAGVQVEAAFLTQPLSSNRGIIALGAAPAASGRWDTVDVRVALDAAGAPVPGEDDLTIALDGKPLPAGVGSSSDGAGVLLTDLPADGSMLQIALRQGDAFAADDGASLLLPIRRPLRVGVAGTLPSALQDVLSLDPSLQLVDAAQAQVLVVAEGAIAATDVPTLQLVAAAGGDPAFHFTVRDIDGEIALAGNLQALGLDQARNTAIANELGRPVGVDVSQGKVARVQTWQELFAADGGFVQSLAMPLFVSRSLHWLADSPSWVPYAAAGQPLQQALLLQGLGQDTSVRDRALGDRVFLPAAGTHAVAGKNLQISLLDGDITRGVAEPIAISSSTAPPRTFLHGEFSSLLFFLALLLCCVEWLLLVRGRVP